MTTVLDITADRRLLRGRGALSNQVGRYEKQARVLVDDGWDDGWRDEDGAPPPLRTEVIVDATRTSRPGRSVKASTRRYRRSDLTRYARDSARTNPSVPTPLLRVGKVRNPAGNQRHSSGTKGTAKPSPNLR